MPRYNYQCDSCEDIITVFHAIDEAYNNCEKCGEENTMIKLLSLPYIVKDKTSAHDNNKVGQLTKQYIDEN